jgi:hypothetical protein
MKEWLRDLESLPARAEKAFKPVMKRAGVQIKKDWIARWSAMPHAHIPHLVKPNAIGFDDPKADDFVYSVEVGVTSPRPQSRLATFIEFGTETSAPHPAGRPALEAEAPKMADAAEQVAADLLDKA